VEASTAGSGAPNVLISGESRKALTNEGTTAKNYHTLPTAAVGLEFMFVVRDTDGLRVTAAANDVIRLSTVVSPTAGYVESTDVGSTLRLLAVNSTVWVSTYMTGVWDVGTELSLLEQTALEITAEATRSNDDVVGRPLPLASNWNVGEYELAPGFTPEWQLARIAEGHHLLPCFHWPYTTPSENYPDGYFDPMADCAALNLPISLRGSQWEDYFNTAGYIDLPLLTNPNWMDDATNLFEAKSDPLGPLDKWSEIAAFWNEDPPELADLITAYPNPPLVLLISNNEYPKPTWIHSEESQRWITAHGTGQTEAFMQQEFAEGYVTRYKALTDAMKAGFSAALWRDNSICVAYEAAGSRDFAVSPIWNYFTYAYAGNITSWHRAWDGSSPPFYAFPGTGILDFNLASPQLFFMAQKFMIDFSYSENPDYWYELSVWDGYQEGGPVTFTTDQDVRAYYASIGQPAFTTARYVGMVQFGMWMLQPRVVRDFRSASEDITGSVDYYLAVIDAVDRVHTNATLKSWWRSSTLVNNEARDPPHNAGGQGEWAGEDRNWLLTTDLDPAWPPATPETVIPVFALARTRGTTPSQEWLVYAHSPIEDRTDVTVTVPGYGDILIDVPKAGAFYVVLESDDSVTLVT